MNCTARGAITKAFHYPDLDDLKARALAFASTYGFAKHVEALRSVLARTRGPEGGCSRVRTYDPLIKS